MFAPGAAEVMQEFHITNTILGSIVVSIYVLGLAFGPLVLAPISEVYGRWICYTCCNILYLVFTIACAVSTNLPMLIIFRFLAGCMGACPLTVGAGTIADLFPVHQRGLAISLYSLGPVSGPAIGPVAGGFLSQAKGWRWIFWVLSMTV
jgi:multidrug resistance protein